MAERNTAVSLHKLVRRTLEAGVAAVWLVGSTGALQAQSVGGAIEGTVRSAADSLPVRQATVQITGSPLGVLTGEQGSFRIVRIEPGTYTLRFSAPGYEQTSHPDVVVNDGESVRVDLYIRPTVINVPGLVVTASRSRERPDESPVSVSVLGECPVKLWGLSSRERLRRDFEERRPQPSRSVRRKRRQWLHAGSYVSI